MVIVALPQQGLLQIFCMFPNQFEFLRIGDTVHKDFNIRQFCPDPHAAAVIQGTGRAGKPSTAHCER